MIALIFLSAAAAYGAEPLRCEQVFLSQAQSDNALKAAGKFAQAVERQLRNKSNIEIAEHLYSTNSAFKKRVDEAFSKQPPTPSELELALASHHRDFITSLEKNLWQLRDESLKRALSAHGAALSESESGFAALERISQENLARIRETRQIKKAYLSDPEIAKLVSNIELSMVRNSLTATVESNWLMSSYMIEQYGLSGGLNSKAAFNKDFLKSDNDVFFYVVPKMKWATTDSVRENRYGGQSMKLNPINARHAAWVSPFIMYPDNLLRFAATDQPAEFGSGTVRYRAIQSELDRIDDSGRQNRVSFEASNDLRNMKERLHRYDFTANDYLSLLKDAAGTWLLNLKTANALHGRNGPNWQGAVTKLLSRDSSGDAVFALVEKEFGIPRMELKVPVAVSASQLTQ